MDTNPQVLAAQQQAAHMMAVMLPIVLLSTLVAVAFAIWLFWRIFSKAGMSGALSLLILVPGVGGLIVLCILAFGEWKVVPAPQGIYAPPPAI